MFAENNRVLLSSVLPRFYALCEGDTMELSCRGLGAGRPFTGRNSSSVLSRLSLRGWANIQAEMSARHAEILVATRGVRRLEGEE
jgi:hypothetical protein